MANTTDNLKEAFAGESQANQKYRAFADRAEKDGFPNVARLFRTTAEAERIHAAGHLGALDGIGSTSENLQSAIDGETYEYTEMYPPMFATAESEGHKAKRMFNFAVSRDILDATPAAMVRAPAKENQRDRVLSADEIRVFWNRAIGSIR